MYYFNAIGLAQSARFTNAKQRQNNTLIRCADSGDWYQLVECVRIVKRKDAGRVRDEKVRSAAANIMQEYRKTGKSGISYYL